jgi:ornithine carbamoyltransferase
MGKEKEAWGRKMIFGKYQINKKLVALAKPTVLIMHCLPAHRGLEITDEVMDSPNSIVFDQAENRLHVQKAILLKLLGANK